MIFKNKEIKINKKWSESEKKMIGVLNTHTHTHTRTYTHTHTHNVSL